MLFFQELFWALPPTIALRIQVILPYLLGTKPDLIFYKSQYCTYSGLHKRNDNEAGLYTYRLLSDAHLFKELQTSHEMNLLHRYLPVTEIYEENLSQCLFRTPNPQWWQQCQFLIETFSKAIKIKNLSAIYKTLLEPSKYRFIFLFTSNNSFKRCLHVPILVVAS